MVTSLPPVPFVAAGFEPIATDTSPNVAAFPRELIATNSKPASSSEGKPLVINPLSPGKVLGEKSMSAPALIDADLS